MSETLPLSAERLRELQAIFRRTVATGEWYRTECQRHRQLLERVQGWSIDELRAPAAQKELWEKSHALGSVGSGRNVNTSAVYTDQAVVDALVALRERKWPEQPEACAEAIRRAYEEIMALVHPRLSTRQPAAKLLRVFAALVPAHFHRCFDSKSNKQVARLVLGQMHDRVRGAVLVRGQLRKVLGVEGDLDTHVKRSFFCWWLHGQYTNLRAGAGVTTVLAEEPATRGDDEQSTPLTLWPYGRQRKGLPGTGGYANVLRAVIRSCEGGASPEDMILAMREEHSLEHLQASSFRALMNTAKALGLIDHSGGLWSPSEAGEGALDPDEPDILIERVLERVYGMAHLLRAAEQKGPCPRAELIRELQKLYPTRQTDRTPSTFLLWAASLSLMEQEGGLWRLTDDYGKAWARRLPEILPSPRVGPDGYPDADVEGPQVGVEPDELGVEPPGHAAWRAPSFDAIREQFRTDDVLQRFVFDEDQLAELHLAWHPPEDGELAKKRFVILSGLSGTGKTAILTHYARIYCRLAGVGRPDGHCSVVAVSPDWRDPGGLLGYVNALTPDPTYLREPALVLLLDAVANPHLPYFLILDEMNLAHPEHYFAPFLSAMETGGRLDLHAHDSPFIDVPPSIPWPRNLFIGGTVNMDETTHAFSDKVLDRAFTIELWDVDLPRFFERRRERDLADVADIDAVHAFFIELNGGLAQVRRHVGYRSVGEAIDFVRSGARAGLLADAQALWSLVDRAVHAKVLPRLRGHDSDDLRKALATARQVCEQRGMTRCVSKLARMLARLDETGVTRFFA
jgi:5-methylcytosine-specific restriction protein B